MPGVSLVYTTPVDPSTIDERVSTTVHLFQANVPKTHDVRLVATSGGHVHAVAIHTDDPAGRQDFRTAYDSLKYVAAGGDRHTHRRHTLGSGLVISDDWRVRAAAFADRLTEQGVITEAVWRDVVASVPRHVFVRGTLGCPDRAPYERVIATVANEQVPYGWVTQTRPGGVILADVRPHGMIWAGALARLTIAEDGTARGPLVDFTWGFMSTRPDVVSPRHPGHDPDRCDECPHPDQ